MVASARRNLLLAAVAALVSAVDVKGYDTVNILWLTWKALLRKCQTGHGKQEALGELLRSKLAVGARQDLGFRHSGFTRSMVATTWARCPS